MKLFSLKTARTILGGLFILSLLTACSSVPLQSDALLAETAGQAVSSHELDEVAFFPQEAYQCGPAALATVLDWSGSTVTPDDLRTQVYIPERKGSLRTEMVAAARGYDRIPYRLKPQLGVLLQELRAGHPVLVMQNLGLNWLPQWHYAVVVGYDLESNQLVLRSGTRRRHVMSLQAFERTWRRADYWALVVLRPDQLPVSAQELDYLQAVARLERVGRLPAAQAAYRNALRQWPESIGAWMGLGNSAYALGDKGTAVQAFRQLLAVHEDYAPALNNLAQTLADKGRLDEARELAQKAVGLGGRQSSLYRQTLEQIEAKLAVQ